MCCNNDFTTPIPSFNMAKKNENSAGMQTIELNRKKKKNPYPIFHI